jgi:transcription termination/antitermination protein NusG
MTNTYAINTTRGKEFEVEAAMLTLGLQSWVPRRLDSRYVKEKRESAWYDRAYIPKLMFGVIPAIYWPDVLAIKHVIGKPIPLSQRDIQGAPAYVCKVNGKHMPSVPGLSQFRAAVEAEYADAERRKANTEYQCQYAPGQALTLLAGAFDHLPAQFVGVIKRAHDDYTKLRVSVEIFGRATHIEVDPDKVRA